MTWTKLDDNWTDRPEMFDVSRSARFLLIEMYVWANRHNTDGIVPQNALRRLSDSDDTDGDIAALVRAGLVETSGDGWLLDWRDQQTAEEVEAKREINRAKQAAYRERGGLHARGDHSKCTAKSCSYARNQGSNPVTNQVSNDPPTRPVPSPPSPSRPLGLRDGEEGESHAAARASGPASCDEDEGLANPSVRPHAHVGDDPFRCTAPTGDDTVCELPAKNRIHHITPHGFERDPDNTRGLECRRCVYREDYLEKHPPEMTKEWAKHCRERDRK